jgi:cyclopropane fatty-acyl-phospholipid synthase-like methyltransferase
MEFSQEGIASLRKFYEDALRLYGPLDPRSVHWSEVYTQRVRFEALVQIGSLEGTTILDVGCGVGALYRFLQEQEISCTYTGIDVVPEFIEEVKKNFPEATFLTGDFNAASIEQYDYILSSGAMTFRVPEGKACYFSMLKKMYTHAKKGVACTFLHASFHPSDETYLAYLPEEVEKECSTYAQESQIITGYLPYDFTVYLIKENTGRERKNSV